MLHLQPPARSRRPARVLARAAVASACTLGGGTACAGRGARPGPSPRPASTTVHAPADTAAPTPSDSAAARRGASRRGGGAGHTSRHEIFPSGHLFAPLVASLEEAQFRNSYLLGDAPNELHTRLAVTQPGANVALMRMHGRRPGDGWDMSIAASAVAVFDMASPHWDLLDADYRFSYPIEWRRGRTSARVRYQHTSTHLGDEYLTFRHPPDGFAESYRLEEGELLVARDLGGDARWRLYGGVDHAFSVAPASVRRNRVQWGAEYRRPAGGRWGDVARAEFLAAGHVGQSEDQGWAPGVSLRTGVQIRRGTGDVAQVGGSRYRALLEFYNGPAPFGQFARFYRVRYVGVGCYVVP